MMEVTQSPPQPHVSTISWEKLDQKIEKVRAFFGSLNPADVGNGRMIYDEKSFTLESRSSSLKGSPTWQYLTTIGCESASFDATRDGFAKLRKRVKALHDQILQFRPQSAKECPDSSRKLCLKMIDLQNLIQSVSNLGFNQLCTNYRNLGKNEEASALENLGQDAFSFVKKGEEYLYQTLLPYFPELENDAQIKRFYSNSEIVLLDREEYRAHLRGVIWDKDKGVVLPAGLLEDCIKDEHHSKIGPNPAALRVAATHIGIPKKASPTCSVVPKRVWIPHRVVEKKESLVRKRGVVGSCEGRADLCNAYSWTDPKNGYSMMSCSLVDTNLKAKELALMMKDLLKQGVKENWIAHQLSSFSQEESSIIATHSQIPYVQKKLREDDLPISLFHVNTCFDANWNSKAEERSFREINLEPLLHIAKIIIENTASVVTHTAALTTFAREIGTLIFWLDQAKEFGDRVKKWPDLEPAINDDPDVQPPTLSTLKATLKEANAQIEKGLQQMSTTLSESVASLTNIDTKSPIEQRKAKLLYQLLWEILANQSNSPKQLSPTGEIERYLLLYRMLNLKPIFMCENGIDRSAAVKAIAEAQYLIEETFFINSISMQQDQQGLDQAAAKIEAHEELYRLLKDIDPLKQELFQQTNALLTPLQFPFVKDLQECRTYKDDAQTKLLAQYPELKNDENKIIATNIRNVLLHEIEATCRTERNSEKGSDLYRVQLYLELVITAHLLGQEKTLNAYGAIGYQHLHDASWLYRRSRNPHPHERWPLFILTDQNMPIQILEHHQLGWTNSWYSDSLTITPAGLSLTHRLNRLR